MAEFFETLERFDLKMIGLNVAAVALLTVGAFASLYAGYLNPNYRLTASSLSAVVNGFATLAMFIFIDPQLSILTDDVMDGSVSESKFRKVIIYLVGARIAGTALAQVVFVPAAVFTASIAKLF